MSQEVAPAVAKVGALEAQAQGSTMDSGKINIAINPPAPSSKPAEAIVDAPVTAPERVNQPEKTEKPEKPEQPEQSQSTESKVTDVPGPAAAHALTSSTSTARSLPKPVQIQSVPETPANTANSVNGTPRPELNLSAMVIDPAKPSEDEAAAVFMDPPATALTSAPKSDGKSDGKSDESNSDKPAKENGAPVPAVEMTGALQTAPAEKGPEPAETVTNGKKRKLDDDPGDDDGSGNKNVEGQQEAKGETERANKKAKVETEAEAKINGRPKAKPGRPRKDKSKPRVVGQTARKTRSQGPAEA